MAKVLSQFISCDFFLQCPLPSCFAVVFILFYFIARLPAFKGSPVTVTVQLQLAVARSWYSIDVM